MAGHVGELLIQQQRRVRVPLAYQAGIKPLLRDALELAEQVELGLLTSVSELRVEQPPGEFIEQRRLPHVAEVLEAHVGSLTNNAGVLRDRRPHQIRRQFEHGVVVELGLKMVLG